MTYKEIKFYNQYLYLMDLPHGLFFAGNQVEGVFGGL